MENKKQTAVEWLYHQIVIKNSDVLKWGQYLEEAKEMERKQIEDAFGKERIIVNSEGCFKLFNSKQYYNQYYNKKQKNYENELLQVQ